MTTKAPGEAGNEGGGEESTDRDLPQSAALDSKPSADGAPQRSFDARSHRGDARVRFATWPHRPDVAHLVLLDHNMLPTPADVATWVANAQQQGSSAIRTGALFPEAAAVFLDADFTTIDTLALLDGRLNKIASPTTRRDRILGLVDRETPTSKLRPQHLVEVAALDREAFGDPWGNDVDSLSEIANATPHHRARIIRGRRSGDAGTIDAFAISGQSGMFGYLQRIAVRPGARRRGLAAALIADATSWMQRRGATTVMVNTAVDNEAALGLYASLGFGRRAQTLSILERTLR